MQIPKVKQRSYKAWPIPPKLVYNYKQYPQKLILGPHTTLEQLTYNNLQMPQRHQPLEVSRALRNNTAQLQRVLATPAQYTASTSSTISTTTTATPTFKHKNIKPAQAVPASAKITELPKLVPIIPQQKAKNVLAVIRPWENKESKKTTDAIREDTSVHIPLKKRRLIMYELDSKY